MLTVSAVKLKENWYKKGFVVGIIALPIFILLCIRFVFFPDPPIKTHDLSIVDGEINEAYMQTQGNGRGDLIIGMTGDPVVFKLFEMFYDETIAAKFYFIQPGQKVEAGILSNEIMKPRHDNISGIDFRQIYTLKVVDFIGIETA